MGFLAEVLATTRTECVLTSRTRAVLDAVELKELAEALTLPQAETSAIRRALNVRGVSVSLDTIRRHRGGECCCDRVR